MKAWHLLLVLCVLTSCKDPDVKPELTVNNTLNLPTTPYDYGIHGIPDLSNNIITLGRVLFYDPKLSLSGTISCSSCHKQRYSFADNTPLSKGIYDQKTLRNSIALDHVANVANQKLLFWDGRANDLKSMVLMPIMNEREMGVIYLDDKIAELNSLDYYRPLYLNAFGLGGLSKDNLSKALSAFIISMPLADDSNFDKHMASGGGTSKASPYMNATEVAGFNLFMTTYNCASCHDLSSRFIIPNPYAPKTSGIPALPPFSNIGLDAESEDKGLGGLNYNAADFGKFRIPRLRNVELTAPYMHDGRFKTLSEVIDHYSDKIQNSPNLGAELREANGQPKKFNISELQKEQLIAFLRTLTNNPELRTDPKWSDPFKK